MSGGVSSRSENDDTSPAVGIFWQVEGAIVCDKTTIGDAEQYGECLTHAGGHYERWLEWQALGQHGLSRAGLPKSIAYTEYDEWPRGRIVYEVMPRQFVIYADRRLQSQVFITTVKSTFGLQGENVVVRSDSHYR